MVDAREVSQPGAGEELDSPYVDGGTLDLGAWARDALALSLPRAILCRPDCAGLCVVCGADLNAAGPDHHHEAAPDPRWAKLSEISSTAETRQPVGLGLLACRAMAVPKQKQSHSRTTKRRSTHKVEPRRDERVPPVPQPSPAAPCVPGLR